MTTDEVKPLLGAEPFFGQCEQERDVCASDIPVLEASRIRGPSIVFLGLKEAGVTGSALPSSDFKDPNAAVEKLEGTPYFSMDVVDLDEDKINEVIESTELAKDGLAVTFMEPRASMSSLDGFTAAVFSEARSMVDWNQRNKVSLTGVEWKPYADKRSSSSVPLVGQPSIPYGPDGNCLVHLYFRGLITQTGNLVPPGSFTHYIGHSIH